MRVTLDGELFTRLTASQLRMVVVGKRISDPTHGRGYPPWTMIFHKNGMATVFSDRDDWNVPYRVTTKSIQVHHEGFPAEHLAFFQSADGDLAMGNYPQAGCLRVSRMIVEAAE
jgi:hypothetical protein